MYIHIGAGKLVREKELIGIFDLDGAVTPEATADFLKNAERSESIEAAGFDLPRSFVLTVSEDSVRSKKRFGKIISRSERKASEHGETVILSHISSSKLSGRVNSKINLNSNI